MLILTSEDLANMRILHSGSKAQDRGGFQKPWCLCNPWMFTWSVTPGGVGDQVGLESTAQVPGSPEPSTLKAPSQLERGARSTRQTQALLPEPPEYL